MKKVVFISFFVHLSLSCFSQDVADTYGNFISQNGIVYWKYKFDKIFTFDELLISVKKSRTLKNIDTFNNTIVGESIEGFMDYRGAGFTLMSTPTILSNNSSYRSYVVIENYSDGYVVTVNKIIFINQNDSKRISPLFGSAQGEITPIEAISIKNNGMFSNIFIKSMAKIIDFTLKKNFTF